MTEAFYRMSGAGNQDSTPVDLGPVWPNALNTGPRDTPTQEMAGAAILDTDWFTSHPFPGAGTQGNPYVISRVLFTDTVVVGDWDPSTITGKYVKFVDCRFYGNPNNPTEGGTTGLSVRNNGPRVIVEYCTIGPNASPLSTGGPPPGVGGMDKAFQSFVPFEMRYCNVWGASILVYFETERNEASSIIEGNYLHDVWFSPGDHTDLVNGNQHASHVTVKGNYLDGIRTGNQAATNGIGIYDDPDDQPGGIIEDWTVEGNYILRCATSMLCSAVPGRFLNPFVVKNNVFGSFTQQLYAGRVPSEQSGNVDADGNAVTL